MSTGRKLELAMTPEAAARLSALLALPLSEEPLSAEEEAIFAEGERFLVSGERGHTTEEILATLEQSRCDRYE